MPLFCCVTLQDLVKRMLCLDSSKRASIPDILSHRWMRQDNYCGRASFPVITPLAPAPSKDSVLGLPFSFANGAPKYAQQPPSTPPPAEERIGESGSQSGSSAGTLDDFNADSAVNDKLQNNMDDFHRRSALDVESTASLPSVSPSETVVWAPSSDTHPDSAIIKNVSGDSTDDFSPIAALRLGNSVKTRPIRSEAPVTHTDPREGPILNHWPTMDTPVSRLNTPAETPRALSGGGVEPRMIIPLSAGADIPRMDSLDSSRCDSGSSLDSLSFKV